MARLEKLKHYSEDIDALFQQSQPEERQTLFNALDDLISYTKQKHGHVRSLPAQHRRQQRKQRVKAVKFGSVISRSKFQDKLDPMTAEFHGPRMSMAREAVYSGIFGSDPAVTEKEAAQLTAFFFEDIQGFAALERLDRVIRKHNEQMRISAMTGDSRNVEASPMPEAMCKFNAAFKSGLEPSDKELAHVYEAMRLLDSQAQYVTIANLIDKPHIKARCEQLGIEVKGRRARTVARDLLAAAFGHDRKALDAWLDRGKNLDIFTGYFGKALLLLTPPGSITFLQKLFVARLRIGCEILLRECPYLPLICDVLEKYVWPHLQNHSPVPINQAKLRVTRRPWLEQLHSAMTDASDDNTSPRTASAGSSDISTDSDYEMFDQEDDAASSDEHEPVHFGRSPRHSFSSKIFSP